MTLEIKNDQSHISSADAVTGLYGTPNSPSKRELAKMLNATCRFKEDYNMRATNLAPLYRSTIGFDRLFSMLDNMGSTEPSQSYPPYNIERTGENAYRISMAVAGFGEDDLLIESKEHTLTIKGEKQVEDTEEGSEVLFQGIASRSFERRFQLADHVEIKSAELENGLLHIDLVREIPEAMKPRQIAIGKAAGKKATNKNIKQIEA